MGKSTGLILVFPMFCAATGGIPHLDLETISVNFV